MVEKGSGRFMTWGEAMAIIIVREEGSDNGAATMISYLSPSTRRLTSSAIGCCWPIVSDIFTEAEGFVPYR
jgi:hypothetical protein